MGKGAEFTPGRQRHVRMRPASDGHVSRPASLGMGGWRRVHQCAPTTEDASRRLSTGNDVGATSNTVPRARAGCHPEAPGKQEGRVKSAGATMGPLAVSSKKAQHKDVVSAAPTTHGFASVAATAKSTVERHRRRHQDEFGVRTTGT